MILVCVMAPYAGCDRADGVALARAAEWRADARLEDARGNSAYWSEPSIAPSVEAIPGIVPETRYDTQRQCLRALGAALRAADTPIFEAHRDYFMDAIMTPNWNYPRYWACFQEAPLVG
jgi:hypothetical protein